jgi:NADPH:quinone reductase-like Zn-dependent oxidoreductase
MAIMIARALSAIPIATAGSEEKCTACRKLGAVEVINYRTQDFVEATRRFTGGKRRRRRARYRRRQLS